MSARPDPVRAHLHHLAMRGLSPVTIATRQHVLERLGTWLGGHAAMIDSTNQNVEMIESISHRLLSATAADLAAWRASLTVTSATIAGYVSHVREAYAWWHANGYIDSDPAAQLPIPRTPRRLPRPISEDELMEAVDCASLRVRPWLVLAGWCGLRAKEIALLRAENIHLHATPPHLLVASDATKGIRERMIPLSAFVIAEMTGARLPSAGLAFRRIDGRPMRPWLVSKIANDHLHACGIPASLHQLRHRFLTMTYRASHDIRTVQELAGHASLSSTMIYTLTDKAEAIAAVNSLPVPRLPEAS